MVQAVSYFTGFESGDTSELVAVDVGSTIQSTTTRTGAYALKCAPANPTNLALLTWSTSNPSFSATQVVARFYFNFDAAPNGAGDRWFIIFAVAGSVGGYVDAARKCHLIDSAAVDTAGTTVLSTNTWYRAEVVWTATSTFKLYINGVLEINTTDTGASFTATRFYLAGDRTANVFFDDARVDVGGNALVGAGQTIARQGKTGTPTYDSWTKNGAATATLCWSETPLSATNNCSSSTASQAQTMVVEKFSIAQGGHGSETISPLDVINACKAAIVGKTAVSSTAAKIRRRINGTDTDTAVTYSTSDAYYDDGNWTTSFANLDLLEAGVVHGTDTNLENVEDVWVMVDYTPGPPSMPRIEMAGDMRAWRPPEGMIAYSAP